MKGERAREEAGIAFGIGERQACSCIHLKVDDEATAVEMTEARMVGKGTRNKKKGAIELTS